MTSASVHKAIDEAAMAALLGQVANEFIDRLRRGEQPQIEEYAQRYPEIAPVLRQVLPAMLVMHSGSSELSAEAGLPTTQPAGPVALGHFQIHREIGRGGMGIVYEAEQLSLGRRVALKVLPFAAMLDSKKLQRFKNEAHAAAQLHHQHIVPVYSVGCSRGVHFYAMQ
ncbi:MAG: protein kinase, partial [Planctomycetes bacterium]|nr:protein kinase [Planctomycetota bacterium]